MKVASVAEVKVRLSSYVKASATGPVVVTRNGKAVAVLVGVSDDKELERVLMAHSRKLRTILDAADHRIDDGAGVEHEKFWQQVESANRVREENGSGKKTPKQTLDLMGVVGACNVAFRSAKERALAERKATDTVLHPR